jgi:GntR family transcriptional regulator
MIQGKGMKVGTRDVRLEEVPANELVAKELMLKPSDPVIVLNRIRTADDVPVAYTMDYIPTSIVAGKLTKPFLHESLYQYLENELGFRLNNSLLRLVPKKANKQLANLLEIRVGTLLMLLLQTDTDLNHMPVVYSEEYFVGHRFEFMIMRRRRRHSM